MGLPVDEQREQDVMIIQTQISSRVAAIHSSYYAYTAR